MTLKSYLQQKAKKTFQQFAFSAVVYAEEFLGSAAGQEKKEMAINYLISQLPAYLKPFTFIFRQTLNNIADSLIEKAVEKLHQFQKLEVAA